MPGRGRGYLRPSAKAVFVPLDTASRFTALQTNEIDVLSRGTTWTLSRESSLGVMFAAVAYYDGQGFLLRREAKIDTALELGGKTVCTLGGTTTELNLVDYFRANTMDLKPLTFPTLMKLWKDEHQIYLVPDNLVCVALRAADCRLLL